MNEVINWHNSFVRGTVFIALTKRVANAMVENAGRCFDRLRLVHVTQILESNLHFTYDRGLG